jgi:hypothetical protein
MLKVVTLKVPLPHLSILIMFSNSLSSQIIVLFQMKFIKMFFLLLCLIHNAVELSFLHVPVVKSMIIP